MSTSSPTSWAAEPFDEEGDIILRSSDGTDFHVYKVVLILASPWFRTMFSLQQPAESTASTERPVIDVPEDAETLDALLRFCYPIPEPAVDSNLLEKVLEGAIKYELVKAISSCRALVSTFIPAYPLAMYTMCWRLDLEEEAAAAAKEWKTRVDGRMRNDDNNGIFYETRIGLSSIPEMEDLPAEVYQNLLRYIHGKKVTRFCSPPPYRSISSAYGERDLQAWDADRVSRSYPFTLPDANLVLRSTDGIDFPVHRLIVSLNTHSTETSGSYPLLDSPEVLEMHTSKLPILEAGYHSRILGQLLQLIYPPLPGQSVSDWPSVHLLADLRAGVVTAAERSGLLSVAKQYEAEWKRCLDVDPLLLYRIALHSGWTNAATAAASRVSDSSTLTEMIDADTTGLTAGEYHRLLRYIRVSQDTIFAVISKFMEDYEEGASVLAWKRDWHNIVRSYGRRAGITAALMELERWRGNDSARAYVSYKPSADELAGMANRLENQIEQATEDLEMILIPCD
ncbi:BTB domain-containing protein [Phanerochaete sordida]|uniref:BTB domain-containing protein n=1 Tax=Phanerochaete sordida TaxID=48140 RepID=A0A9P3LGF2_9APHY|nr:BTB domain-containing protein [Phanerochaete sordida]